MDKCILGIIIVYLDLSVNLKFFLFLINKRIFVFVVKDKGYIMFLFYLCVIVCSIFFFIFIIFVMLEIIGYFV